jgi:hypothetical protein
MVIVLGLSASLLGPATAATDPGLLPRSATLTTESRHGNRATPACEHRLGFAARIERKIARVLGLLALLLYLFRELEREEGRSRGREPGGHK